MTFVIDGPVGNGPAAPVQEPVEAPPEKVLPTERPQQSPPERAPDPFKFPEPGAEPTHAPLPTPNPERKWSTCHIPQRPNLDSL